MSNTYLLFNIFSWSEASTEIRNQSLDDFAGVSLQ